MTSPATQAAQDCRYNLAVEYLRLEDDSVQHCYLPWTGGLDASSSALDAAAQAILGDEYEVQAAFIWDRQERRYV